MKLTKKLEKEIAALMDDYWDSYMKGNLKHWAGYLPDDYRNIGGTKEEIWNTKKEILDYTKAIADQMIGMADIRNKTIQIIPYDPYFMVHEFMDMFIKVEGKFTFYGKFRLSSLIEKTNKGWKVLHQHGSYPDSKTEEGEAFAFDEIKAENIKLKDAVKRRTLELEDKNRELEIETALEKVRAIAMGMKEPKDMLAVCKTISLQLQSLGVKEIRNVQTAIFYESRGTYMNYEYYAKHRKTIITETSYTNNKMHKAFANQMLKGKDEFFTSHIKGKKVKEWLAYQKTTNVFIDKYLSTASSLNYYWDSLGPVALGMSTYIPLKEEELNLFKRFRNVFEMAYRRYQDIEKAIDQVKESRIETALERVRAVAMAMHKPAHLLDICKTVYSELQELGFTELRNAMINIHDDDKGSFINYDYSDFAGATIANVRYDIYPAIQTLVKESRSANDAFIEYVYSGKKLTDWKKFRKQNGEYDDPRVEKTKALYYYFYSIGVGSIGISAFSAIGEERLEVLKRFRNVFNLSYQRYNDIAKAEEQAREAEIELALERVRARTMAMQKSEELSETTHLLFEQLKSLGQTAAQLSIGIFKEEKGVFELSATVHGTSLLQTYDVPLNEPFVIKKAVKAWKQKKKILTVELRGKELSAYNNWRNSVLKKKIVFPEKQWIVNIIFFSKGLLSFSSDKEISKETFQLLERFANVFDGTYTRFLDLQKAEAQAREAEIELALERVRARTMAMQKSDELAEAASILFQQLQQLGIHCYSSGFTIWDEDHDELISWMCNADGSMNPPFRLSLTDTSWHKEQYQSWKNKEEFAVKDFTGKAMQNHFQYLRSFPLLDEAFKKSIAAGHPMPKRQVHHVANFSFGNLLFITLEPCSESHEIFKRFAKVFDQTYTRFLDLQKAEAQAKEARIETALERVRAVAMAMKKSGEVINVCEVMYKELQSLGFTNIRNAQIALKNDSRQSYSISVYSDNESVIFGEAHYHSSPIVKDLYQELEQSKDAFYQREFSGKKFNDWRKWRQGLSPFADSREASATSMCFYLYSIGIGHIGISTFNAITEIQIEMLKRFKNVFELCYTRYIDVAKAEVQAREAQIELGLERVRARAMAMQHSDELSQLVDTVFKELASLDFALNWCIINIIDESLLTNMVWAANPETNKPPESYLMKFEDYPFHHSMMKGYQERKAKHVYILEGKEKKTYDEYLFNKTEWRRVPKKAQAASRAMKRYVASFTFSNFGGLQTVGEEPLSEENLDILSRFGKVFDLTYTRFNDLQKAEAQAREAQIELGLERVRARAMAMQKSDELKELIGTVFIELTKLDLVLTRCLIMIYHPKSNDSTWWMANSEAPTEPIGLNVQYHEQAPYLAYIKAWNEKKLKWTYSLEGKIKKQWDDFLFTETGLSHLPDFVIAGMKAPDKVYLNASFNSFGNLTLATLDQLSDEHFDIMLRFAKVFDLTYTRFNDLKQAEAQAREAKIETALEKVRSRSMGMQKSDELEEVIQVVYDQFVHLNINTEHAGFVMDYKLRDDRLIWVASKYGLPSQLTIPYFDSVYYNSFNEAKEKGWDFFATNLNFEEKNNFYRQLFAHIPGLPEADREFYFNCPGLAISTVLLENIGLYIENFEGTPYSGEDNAILMRFGKVFQQTYTRFLDLQKAEAQAREAQIENALEKVRSRTMAMQKSTELGETATLLFEQMNALVPDLWSCGFVLCDKNKSVDEWWLSGGNGYMPDLVLPNTGDLTHSNIYKAWLRGSSYHEEVVEGEELQQHYEWLMTIPVAKAAFDAQAAAGIQRPVWQQLSCAYFTQGYLVVITEVPCHEIDLFKRFAKVFDQTYTRFLDLQKAEAQARENQIQLALERARTQSMIMQHSNELDDTLRVFHEQVLLLGIKSAFSFLWLPDEEKSNHIFWAAWEEEKNDSTFFKSKAITYPLDRNEPATAQCLVDWSSDEPVHSYAVKPAEVENYFAAWAELLDGVEKLRPEFFRDGLYYVEAFMKYGCFGVMLENDLSDEEKNILYRFSVEFERTYTRFLDLQKAEAQAREAQIEMALEKVRSKTMAMQRSDELSGTAALLFQEFQKLEQQELIQTTIGIYNEEKNEIEFRATDWTGSGEQVNKPSYGSMDEPTLLKPAVTAWRAHARSVVIELTGEALEKWTNYRNKMTGTAIATKFDGGRRIVSIAFFSKGHLSMSSPLPIPPDAVKTLERFAAVFDGTYTRFLDLQKAEAQARESKIEAGLERVRSRTLAMQSSDELAETAAVLFQQLIGLGIEPNRLYIGIVQDETGDMEMWATDEDGTQVGKKFMFNKNANASVLKLYEGWKSQKRSVIVDMQGKELEDYFHYLNEVMHIPFKDGLSQKRRVQSVAYFSKGFIGMASPDGQGEHTIQLLERFAAVFNLTYTRFNDLQVAEAQTREAKIETALERVRARALAMQEPEELKEVAEVLRHEMGLLGVEELETCSIYINDEQAEKAECWFALKAPRSAKKKLVSDHFALNLNDTWVGKEMLKFYKSAKKQTSIVMQGANRKEWINYCEEKSIPFRGYYGDVIPDRTYHLYKFSHGAIGAASAAGISEESWSLLKRAASVFSLAYSRFKDLTQARTDLQKLKEEKKRAEDALTELQSAQKQLIQSEKMASLGELTAGIAHEIQNPLNFVNNFSEVSKELLDEMKTELDSGNIEDAKEIMADVIQNLEKINHHGKRADGIVKGMLQHSRSSSGLKEPTDINALTDEYIRLCYHGLRAKDKSFNATMKTDFDESIGNVNIIPQDIGRVILNLLTNAFYVVNEKKKSGIESYEPTVTIATRYIQPPLGGRAVEIKVSDNGAGIPQKVLDKIFQPFFTTKPTGQGTGLGLSLAFDIVTKGHAGELKVETKEEEGSTFIIQLPIN